jgi:beta-lactamase superfamily II metal-dependent hydrolase
MFSLEAIKAKHGDCLLLHWGSDGNHRVALIDGGPDTVYPNFLKPRLQQLAEKRGKKELELTMVSHIDDDHINGILALTRDIDEGDAPADIGLLWHNSLEGLLDEKINAGGTAQVTAAANAVRIASKDLWTQKVLASVPQGQELFVFAKRHGISDTMNDPFSPLIICKPNQKTEKIAGLAVTVIAPAAAEVEALRNKWKQLRKKGITAAFDDRSVYNLSSIVVLCEFESKRILLTGDARGDKILQGLETKKLLKNGKMHVDLLKIPHHGSQHNSTKKFFQQVTADTYVVSGDHVKFPNPHKDTMKWLADARGGDDYAMYCTYPLSYMSKIFGDKLQVPKGNETSVVAAL